jgi:4-hydroxybutyryl-CoA dehydratase/vinylacetyl-CoA-Delta-isomerase
MQDVETLWADFATPIKTADDYINSLRGRRMNVFFMGERVPEPVDHPVIKPSVNAMAETFRIASERPCFATVHSDISDRQIYRFLHVPVSPA